MTHQHKRKCRGCSVRAAVLFEFGTLISTDGKNGTLLKKIFCTNFGIPISVQTNCCYSLAATKKKSSVRTAKCTPRHRKPRPSHMLRGIGTIYPSPSFLLIRGGASPPCICLRERLEVSRYGNHRCRGLKTSHNYTNQLLIGSIQQQQYCLQRTIPAAPATRAPTSLLSDFFRRTVHGGGCRLRIPP